MTAAKKPAARKPAAKKPATKKRAANKKPAAKKPAATKRAANRPAANRPTPRRRAPAPPSPAEIIAGLVDDRRTSSDPQLIAELAALPPLRDEDDLVWDDPMYWAGVAYPYLALAESCADRRLVPAIRLLLDRACFGDPGEIMRGLRHSLEAIVNPDWQTLADICIAATGSARPGTVLWAADQLAILDDERARPIFERLLRSEHERIRETAELGLSRLGPLVN